MLTRHRFEAPRGNNLTLPHLAVALENWYDLLNRKGALAIQPQDISHLPVVAVSDHIQPGATDASRGIREAVTALVAKGGGILDFPPGQTLNVWASDTTTLISLSSKVGIYIRGNGCTIDSQQTNGTGYFCVLSGCSRIWIDGLKFLGSNTTLTDSTGEILVYMNDCFDVRVTNCTANDCHTAVAGTAGADGKACQNLVVENLRTDTAYYGINLWGAINVKAQLQTVNAGRSYFVVNGKHHEAWIESSHGGQYSDVLIKTYASNLQTTERNTTRGITVHYTTKGRDSGDQDADQACVMLELAHETSTKVPATMANIDIDLNVTCSSGDQIGNLVSMRKWKQSGGEVLDADGNSAHVIKNIKVSGVALDCDNLRTSGIVLFSASSQDWTTDLATGIRLQDLTMTGTAPTDGVYVNGQPAISARQFLTIDNVFADGAYTEANVTNANIAIKRSKVGSFDAVHKKATAFTPGVSFGGGTTGIAYATQTGSAIRDGEVMEAWGLIVFSSKGSSTGAAKITGLPKARRNNDDSVCPASIYLVNTTFANQHQALVDGGATTISLNEVTEAGTASSLTDADFTNTSTIGFYARYRV